MTPEGAIKKDIYNWLDYNGLVWIKHDPVQMGGGHFTPVRPSQKGAPDAFIFLKGSFLAVEVKSLTGRLSPEQISWAARILAVGGHWVLARSLDDVKKVLVKLC